MSLSSFIIASSMLGLVTPSVGQVKPSSSGRIAETITGRTEFMGQSMSTLGPGFGLTRRDTADIPSPYLSRITNFFPYAGLAQLSGGGCITFLRNPRVPTEPFSRLIGARFLQGEGTCEKPKEGNPTEAVQCDSHLGNQIVAGWRLKCIRQNGRRTTLLAVGVSQAVAGRTVKLAELDEDVRFVSTFGIHPYVAEVNTFGVRRDGKAVLSTYFWSGMNTTN